MEANFHNTTTACPLFTTYCSPPAGCADFAEDLRQDRPTFQSGSVSVARMRRACSVSALVRGFRCMHARACLSVPHLDKRFFQSCCGCRYGTGTPSRLAVCLGSRSCQFVTWQCRKLSSQSSHYLFQSCRLYVRALYKKIKFFHTRDRVTNTGVQAVSPQVHFRLSFGGRLPGLQLPSQPKNVTVIGPVPSYTAW